MENKDQKIVSNIQKLILSLHKNADEEFMNEIKTYSSRLFSSTMSKSFLEDVPTLKDKIISKVTLSKS